MCSGDHSGGDRGAAGPPAVRVVSHGLPVGPYGDGLHGSSGRRRVVAWRILGPSASWGWGRCGSWQACAGGFGRQRVGSGGDVRVGGGDELRHERRARLGVSSVGGVVGLWCAGGWCADVGAGRPPLGHRRDGGEWWAGEAGGAGAAPRRRHGFATRAPRVQSRPRP